jgi:lysophospholipase L1-like esterase
VPTLLLRRPTRLLSRRWPPSLVAAPITPGAITDTFTEAADNVLISAHAPDSGGPWLVLAGSPVPRIIDNRLWGDDPSVNGASGQGLYHNIGVADVRIAAQLAVPSAQNSLSLRAAASASFTGGVRFRVNRSGNTFDLINTGGSTIRSFTPAATIGGESDTIDATFTHYRGHLIAEIAGEALHGWLYDYVLGGPDSGYEALIPTGTRAGIDWSSTGNGVVDRIDIQPVVRASAKHISVIGDSITQFIRTGIGWPRLVGERVNDGVTQVRAYCGGGEGLSKGGSSGNTALNQAQNIVANADDPDWVIIHIGTNDDAASVAAATPNTVQGLMGELLDYLTSNGIAASKIKVMQILPAMTETYHPANRTAIAAAVAARPGITLWDTSGWFDPATQSVFQFGGMDGLHPDRIGQHLIANEIVALLEPAATSTGGRRRVW